MPSKEQVVNDNFIAFQQMLPDLMQTQAGKYALLKDQKVVETFDSIGDAIKFAQTKYPDGLYSVQQITRDVEDLGFFSHAIA